VDAETRDTGSLDAEPDAGSAPDTQVEVGPPVDTQVEAGPSVDAEADTGCRKQWTRKMVGPSAFGQSVTVASGKLSLGVNVGFESWTVKAASTRQLAGDFDVTVKVDSFPHQDPATYLWIAVGEGSDGGALLGGSEEGTGWRGIGWPRPDTVSSTLSATFRFQRFENILAIRVESGSGDKVATRNVQFTTEPVSLFLTLRASHGIPSAGATISEVTVIGGGGALVTDTFDCDSVE
jgi:hypothetical protein